MAHGGELGAAAVAVGVLAAAAAGEDHAEQPDDEEDAPDDERHDHRAQPDLEERMSETDSSRLSSTGVNFSDWVR